MSDASSNPAARAGSLDVSDGISRERIELQKQVSSPH
jgi:hypothetical protein